MKKERRPSTFRPEVTSSFAMFRRREGPRGTTRKGCAPPSRWDRPPDVDPCRMAGDRETVIRVIRDSSQTTSAFPIASLRRPAALANRLILKQARRRLRGRIFLDPKVLL